MAGGGLARITVREEQEHGNADSVCGQRTTITQPRPPETTPSPSLVVGHSVSVSFTFTVIMIKTITARTSQTGKGTSEDQFM